MPPRPGQVPVPSLAGLAATARFDAVVLAGGRATRLGGADKPGLTVGGSTLVAAVVTAAAAAGARRVIVVGPPRAELPPLAASLHARLVATREDPPGGGPVPALRCGLARVREPWVALLAADLPFLRDQHLRTLLAAMAGTARGMAGGGQPVRAATAEPLPRDPRGPLPRDPAGVVLVDDRHRPQWLAGCWRTDLLRFALLTYHGGSLHGLLSPLRPVLLSCDADGQPPPWLDCDTARDLALARRWQRQTPESARTWRHPG